MSKDALVVLGVAVVVAMTGWQMLWVGITLDWLWRWFITPLSNVGAPGVAYCAAISMMARMLVWKAPTKNDPLVDVAKFIWVWPARCLFTLSMFWIVKELAI